MRTPAPHLLFLSGWPGCGEAAYGTWLAANRDFRHLDLASDDPGDQWRRDEWEQLRASQAKKFGDGLLSAHPRWVLTSPAPLPATTKLSALQDAGFALWFLLPRTEGLSRQQWLADERETNPGVRPLAWNTRAEAIRKQAREIRPYFRDRCIETLCSVGERLPEVEFSIRVGI